MDNVDEKSSYDRYWRVSEGYGSVAAMRAKLGVRGYILEPQIPDKTNLIRLLQRQDRGLMCYNRCSDTELKSFATARKVPCYLESNKSAQMSKLLRALTIQTLTEADDNLQFEKFLDLPPELRKRIYEYYDEEFSDALYHPTKPPLARTCRQIRQELLPVFYSTHEFKMELVRRRADVSTFRFSDETSMWLAQLSSNDAMNIKRLSIYVSDRFHPKIVSSPIRLCGCIQLWLETRNGAGKCCICSNDEHSFDEQWNTAMEKRLKQEVVTGFRENMGEKGSRKFTLPVIYNIRKWVNAAYR